MTPLEKHQGLLISQELKQLLEPLNKTFNIDTFYYIEIDKLADKRVILTTSPEWILHFYAQEFYKTSLITRAEYIQTKGHYLWADYRELQLFQDAKAIFNLSSGITLIEENERSTYIYCFGSTDASILLIDNYYYQIMNILKKFVIYFHDKAHQLIKNAWDSPIFLEKTVTSVDPTIENNIRACEYFLDKHIRRLYIRTKNLQDMYLTPKEFLCAYHRSNGLTSKETAKKLDCSSKTVEAHLANIKDKLGSDYKNLYRLLRNLID